MQSHSDNEHELRKMRIALEDEVPKEPLVQRLERRAVELSSRRENEITAGSIGEEVLYEGIHKGVHLRLLPDDPDQVLRVSVGGVADAKYLVLRGAPRQIDQLLTRALMALRQAIGSGNLEAERDGD